MSLPTWRLIERKEKQLDAHKHTVVGLVHWLSDRQDWRAQRDRLEAEIADLREQGPEPSDAEKEEYFRRVYDGVKE